MRADELIVDSFAGGGGASMGIHLALGRGPDIAINHDREAIALHRANHSEARHYTEDVWKVDPHEATQGRPVGLMWLSPDCKHFSKAKGGKPVNKRVRGLAWVAVRWAKAVKPRVIVLENVEEFQTWGPLGPDGRPCPARSGITFRRYVSRLRNLGYQVEWRELRACDYGAPTIRKRLFLIARSDGQPIVWPKPTHGKFTGVPYRSAAECIDWSIPCPSIFARKRPLAEATQRRIARGLKRYVLDAEKPFIVPQHEVAPFLTEHANASSQRVFAADEPLRTQCAEVKGGHFALVAAFLAKHFSERKASDVMAASLFDPMPTVTTVDHNALTTAYLSTYYGGESGEARGQSLTAPLGTQTTANRHALVRAFLVAYFGNEKDGGSLFDPVRTVTTKDRFGLVTVAGQDYIITDIGMRMLVPRELFRAQGFPDSYIIEHGIDANGRKLKLTKTAQVRMCGNSVAPPVAAAIVAANLTPHEMERAA